MGGGGHRDGAEDSGGIGDAGIEDEQSIKEIVLARTDGGDENAIIRAHGDAFGFGGKGDFTNDGRGGEAGVNDVKRGGIMTGDVKQIAIAGEGGGEGERIGEDGGQNATLGDGKNVDAVERSGANEVEQAAGIVEHEVAGTTGNAIDRT